MLIDSSTPSNSSAAVCISEQCDGTLTGIGKVLFAPSALAFSIAASTDAYNPAITTCPGALKLTASTMPN